MLPVDLHTHTAASGHGTTDTVADLAKSAAQKGMALLGISDHGPATPGSCRESYFRGLSLAPKQRAGISLLYGAEANITDISGNLDLEEKTLCGLDFCIASIHPPTFHNPFYHRSSFWDGRQITEDLDNAKRLNTEAYLRVMENPFVNFIGHPDDQRYPADYERLVEAAVKNHVYLEINEASLTPGSFRGDVKATAYRILELCEKSHHPVLLSSDSHGAKGVGEAPLAEALVREAAFPRELILNYFSPEALRALLKK